MEFIQSHLGDIIVSVILIAVVIRVIFYLYKKKGSPCGCSGCTKCGKGMDKKTPILEKLNK